MSRTSCMTEPQELLQYWLGELDAAHEQRLDEHLFACSVCSGRLAAIVDLGASVRGAFAGGTLNVVLPEPFMRTVKEAGLRVREYSLDPGGSVACTVTRDDDLVVAYLHAPLRDVRRLDVVIDDTTSGRHRANDVAFDPAANGLVAVTSTAYLRTLGHSQHRVRLVAVDGVDERVIGDYTFNHSPS